MTDLEQLAGRCEKANGPDRKLDMGIFKAIGAPVPFQFANRLIALEYNDIERAYFARVSDDMQVRYSPPAYTASLDAAMTLVPDDMRDEIEITTLYQVARVGINLNHAPDDCPYYGSNQCNSIPLALCAAALRARAAK